MRQFVAFILVVGLSACGPQVVQAPCSAATCNGCCAPSGKCEAGVTAEFCGFAGAACNACPVGNACSSSGVCVAGAVGGGSAVGGGAAGAAGGQSGGGLAGGGAAGGEAGGGAAAGGDAGGAAAGGDAGGAAAGGDAGGGAAGGGDAGGSASAGGSAGGSVIAGGAAGGSVVAGGAAGGSVIGGGAAGGSVVAGGAAGGSMTAGGSAGGSMTAGGVAGGSVIGGGAAGGSVAGGGAAGGGSAGGGSAGGSVVGGGSAGGSVGGGSAGGSPACNTGQVVTGTGAVASGTITAGAGSARASCAPSFTTTGTERYFLWTAPATGNFTFDTNGSTFDTILSASNPTTCAELACDDDSGNGVASLFTLNVTAGQTVRLMLDTYSQTTAGSFTLNIASNNCPMGTHACGMTCAPNTSVASCGSSCVACPVPMNGTATCDGTSCGVACNAGFQRCASSCVSSATATWQARPNPLPFTFLSPPAWGVDSTGALWHAWMQTSTSIFGDPQLDVYVGSPTRAPVMVHRYTGFYASVSTDSTHLDALTVMGGDLCFFFSSNGDLRRTCRAAGFTTSTADPAIGLEYGLATDSAGLVYKVTASTTSLTLTGASVGTIDVFSPSAFVPVNDVAVALDALGGVHVLYSLTTSTGLFVKYARRSGTTWTVSTLEEINLNTVVPMAVGRGSLAVAVTPAGVVHLAWTRRWRRVVSGSPAQNAEDVRHAISMGGATPTAITTVITGFAVGNETAWNTNQVQLAVDATGTAQLVFAYQPSGTILNNDSRQTWYGVWNGSSFTTSRIGGVQALQLGRFGFDGSQRPTSQEGGTTLTLSVCPP